MCIGADVISTLGSLVNLIHYTWNACHIGTAFLDPHNGKHASDRRVVDGVCICSDA